jgi:hypothetical protein
MRRQQPDPETLAEVITVMHACGYLTVEVDPTDDSKVLVRAAPRLIQMIEERGVTMNDCVSMP